jgi:hypothetical protein
VATVTRKRKMQARANAERVGRQTALREAREVYLLVYAARGRTGPYPLSSLSGPGLLGEVERGYVPFPLMVSLG